MQESTDALPETDHGFDDDAEPDLRIALSRFTRHAACVTAATQAALASGVGIDASTRSCRYIVKSNVPFIAASESTSSSGDGD